MTDPVLWNRCSDSDLSASENDESSDREMPLESNLDPPSTVVETDVPPLSSESEGVQPTSRDVFDFSKSASPCEWPDITTAIPSKHVRVKRKFGSKEEKVMRLHREGTDNILEKMATRFSMNKDRIRLEYSIKTEAGGERIITIGKEDGEEGQEIFYCQVEQMALVTVSEAKVVPKRKKRPCELKAKALTEHSLRAIDRKFYDSLIELPDVAESFLRKKKYIQLVLGMPDCSHLLNPCYAICHVQSCCRLVKLKSLNNISSLVDHWKVHALGTTPNESCVMAVARHTWLMQHHSYDTTLSSEDLEGSCDDSGKKLTIAPLVADCFKPKAGLKFKGEYLMTDDALINKIALGDPSVSNDLPANRQGIRAFVTSSSR